MAVMHLSSCGFLPDPPALGTWHELGKSSESEIAPWWVSIAVYRSELTELETSQFLKAITEASEFGVRRLVEPKSYLSPQQNETYYTNLESNSKRFIELLGHPYSRLSWVIINPRKEFWFLGSDLLVSNIGTEE